MKALTLTQPWATLVAIGAKRIETRSWSTNYRGPLAIHAAMGMPTYVKRLCDSEPFRTALNGVGATWLRRGVVIATCRLVDVLPTMPASGHGTVPSDAPHEFAFGDFSPGRFMWLLENVVALPEPVPARGALGLWEWTR